MSRNLISTFTQVMEFMQIVGVNEQKQAVIVGSSFGGLLAVNVAHQVRAFRRASVEVFH